MPRKKDDPRRVHTLRVALSLMTHHGMTSADAAKVLAERPDCLPLKSPTLRDVIGQYRRGTAEYLDPIPEEIPPVSDSVSAPDTATEPPGREAPTPTEDTVIRCPQPMTEEQLLTEIRKMLANIRAAERPTTAPGRDSTLRTRPVTARLPVDLLNRLTALGGHKSAHVERALKLYLLAMEQETDD